MEKESISVIYEDASIIAINKPPRMASVPSRDFPLHKTVLGRVQQRYAPMKVKPYILHRLDYDTSGILLFGKEQKNRRPLENIFRDRRTEKIYAALVKGIPHGTSISSRLRARHSDRWIPAHTRFHIEKTFPVDGSTCSLVETTIATGRKHQIRQHFAKMRCPIVMDRTYGNSPFNRSFRKAFGLNRQFLHAHHISFFHPLLEKTVRITAPFPEDLAQTLQKLQECDAM
ncbi:MAG TPA: RluA family pseudouridine synthase [Patescibacteria group bacterium]|nr:RluA family pseudouridine synthase [Patescibacteria group bacterium]